MDILKPGEELVVSTTDHRSGDLGFGGVNDAYDLYLVKSGTGNYILIVFMKVQFFFVDAGKLKWTFAEKNSFVTQWEEAIKSTWGRRTLKRLESGRTVSLDFRFETQIEGWMLDHWELTVKRIPRGAFNVSKVNPVLGNVFLDSEDFNLVPKGNGQKQRGVVHEFGHMLGIDDEYKADSPYSKDYRSIMNSGEVVGERHDAVYVKWLEKVLLEGKIN
ncbi:hypothetical protein [Cystobacter ferrugineus]|uniref:Uncharacterized protein n=1 Tax=Cystobacter ferrugineus TaxID=83449 RepID=A0A1L9BJ15_9BACT|nr:hypothetical protein [Cystobacter ferrugineus]OJH42260.1 hypothetical protein BON30_03355 [Cystobacter ferrugineus]